jgi:hypothetical protein
VTAAGWLHLPVEGSVPACGRAAVGVFATALGCHVGVLCRRDDEAPRAIHLAFHHRLQDEPAGPTWGWVAPALSDDKLRLVAAAARRVQRAHADGKVPYALRVEASRFEESGRLVLGAGELGLTCAAFVLLVFRNAGVELLDCATWTQRSPERTAADEEAQAVLVAMLRRDNPAHADAVAAEVGCLRFRPEEVAAASAHPPHPVDYARAEALGQLLIAALRAPSALPHGAPLRR